LCLDDSGAVLEVEGSRNAGGIRLKVVSVDCLWSWLVFGCGRGGVENTGGFKGRTSAGFLVLDTSCSGVLLVAKVPEVIKRCVPLLTTFLETEESESSAVGPVSNTDLKFKSVGGLYTTFGFG
jgi:hypothetical protein